MGEPIKCWVVWFEDSASKGAPDPGVCKDEFGNPMSFGDKSKAENEAKAWRSSPEDERYTVRPATLTVGESK